MINPATDCRSDLGPADWAVMGFYQLEIFATRGNQEQKDSLLDWAYSGLPAWLFEHLFFLATNKEWQQD